MRHRESAALAMMMTLLSGCFQEEAPRNEAPAAVAARPADPRVRQTAVEALGEIGGDTARMLLQQALADVDQGVREAAQQMLDKPVLAQRELR